MKFGNKKNLEKVDKYVHPEYIIYLDTADPWEGKTLNHVEFKKAIEFFL